MIKEILLKKVIEMAIEGAKRLISGSKIKLLTDNNDLEDAISYHLQCVKIWAEDISFADLGKSKYTADIFVELNVYVHPKRWRISTDEAISKIPLKEIFNDTTNHIILLGHPGAGKTTSMKQLCQALFYDEDFQKDRFSHPILIKLRDLNKSSTPNTLLIEELYNILGLKLEAPMPLNILPSPVGKETEELRHREFEKQQVIMGKEYRALKEKLVLSILDSLNALLILDGFDEMGEGFIRQEVIQDLEKIASYLEHSIFILTSRTGDFTYSITKTVQYELSPLTDTQISEFAHKWLNDDVAASAFLKSIHDSPFADTTIRPLNLSHLCAIYEREGKIPDKPKSVYRKIINLLLREWDQQRGVNRISRYAKFEVDRKEEFLSHLAFKLTTDFHKSVFSKNDLLIIYRQIYQDYDLLSHEAQQVVSELETHTGLFIQTGYEQFEFAHKSLQEFLTADFLVKLPAIPIDEKLLIGIPNELAISVTISSMPGDFFCELVMNRLARYRVYKDFIKPFLTRLVIEKPDFNKSNKVGISLLVLYSLYIESDLINGDELNNQDELHSYFEKMLGLIFHKGSLDLIEFLYGRDRVFKMSNGDKIFRLINKSQDPSDIYQFWPATLYIKESLLNIYLDKQETDLGKD